VRAAADFVQAFDREAVRAHEGRLLAQMVEGLAALEGVTLHGAARDRTSTIMFSVAGRSARDVAAALARAEVAVWDGNYYALELSRWLGLEPDGAIRAGCVVYNDAGDVDRLIEAVAAL
jgi:selenocysteine lyase/cysteine desulfurase